MVALVSEERGYSSGSVRSIVVCKFSEGKEFRPVVLLVVAVDPKVLFKCLVHAFSLTVAFRVIVRGEMEVNVEGLSEGAEEMRHTRILYRR